MRDVTIALGSARPPWALSVWIGGRGPPAAAMLGSWLEEFAGVRSSAFRRVRQSEPHRKSRVYVVGVAFRLYAGWSRLRRKTVTPA